MDTSRKNLIICAAGDDSLHRQWYVPERSYDIMVLYYGNNGHESLKGTCDYFIAKKGYKMELARNYLAPHFYQNPEFYSGYEYIWFPDCDIELGYDDDIQNAIDAASYGDVICVTSGTHPAIKIDRSITLLSSPGVIYETNNSVRDVITINADYRT